MELGVAITPAGCEFCWLPFQFAIRCNIRKFTITSCNLIAVLCCFCYQYSPTYLLTYWLCRFITMFPNGGLTTNFDLRTLRAVRVLRPLKLVSGVPSLSRALFAHIHSIATSRSLTLRVPVQRLLSRSALELCEISWRGGE